MSYTIYEIIIAALAIGTATFAVTVYVMWLADVHDYNVFTDKDDIERRIIVGDIGIISIFTLTLIGVGSIVMWQESIDAKAAETKASALEQRFNEEKAEYDDMEKLAEHIAQLIKDGSSERM